jgi:8-oxo-dGTP pyrophosphatase MutT (NUDIX family)
LADTPLDSVIATLRRRLPVRADVVRPQAAVALILVRNPDRLLLIRRADRAGDPWSGHLALPGGRRAVGDATLLDTAIRESHEEVGITLTTSECMAELDDLVPMTAVLPPIVVRPFLFLVGDVPSVGVSDEVASVAWLPLATLAASGAYRTTTVMIRGERRDVAAYPLEAGVLWGMTERIVTPLVDLWRAATAGGDRPA